MSQTKITQIPIELTEEQLADAGIVYLSEAEAPGSTAASPEAAQINKDIGNRIIWLDHEITQADDGYICRYILQWNRDDIGIPIEERKPIYLFINSPGGDISVTFSLYDTIMMSKTPVYGVNMGYAFSGAIIVLLACAKRFGTAHSWYMAHRGSGECSVMDHMSAHNSMEHWDAQVEDLTEILSVNTNIEPEDAQRYMMTDTYFDSTRALDLGIIDKIIVSLDEVFPESNCG
jgi:ATP-dependent Clp protease protease subunit